MPASKYWYIVTADEEWWPEPKSGIYPYAANQNGKTIRHLVESDPVAIEAIRAEVEAIAPVQVEPGRIQRFIDTDREIEVLICNEGNNELRVEDGDAI